MIDWLTYFQLFYLGMLLISLGVTLWMLWDATKIRKQAFVLRDKAQDTH